VWASRYLVAQPSVEKLRRFLEADRERIESLMPPPSARKRLPSKINIHRSAILPLPLISITPLATSGRTTAGQPYLSFKIRHSSIHSSLDLPPFNGTTFRGSCATLRFLQRHSPLSWRRLISLRLNGKSMGRSDRAHADFYRAGYLLEDLALLAATENLRSDCFVLGHEKHGRLVPTLAINPSVQSSGRTMHSDRIANRLGADAQGGCGGLAALDLRRSVSQRSMRMD